MKFRTLIMLTLALVFASTPLLAQDEGAKVDTTFYTEDGMKLRYRGTIPFGDKPGGIERFKDRQDDRVPLGYGWKSLTGWKEGDPRPAPIVEPGRVISEYVELIHDPVVQDYAAKNFAEYWDYAYHAVKDRLGWTLDKPVPVVAPVDIEEYGREHGLPWWIPGDVVGDTIVVEAIGPLTARGIALESITHSLVEWHIRRKTGDRVPYWFIYGAGATLGAAGWILQGQVDVLDRELWNVECSQETMIRDLELFRDPEVVKREIESPGITEKERTRSRIAFWRAYNLGQNILLKESLGKFKTLIENMEADPALSFESAVKQVYGIGVDQLVAKHEPW